MGDLTLAFSNIYVESEMDIHHINARYATMIMNRFRPKGGEIEFKHIAAEMLSEEDAADLESRMRGDVEVPVQEWTAAGEEKVAPTVEAPVREGTAAGEEKVALAIADATDQELYGPPIRSQASAQPADAAPAAAGAAWSGPSGGVQIVI